MSQRAPSAKVFLSYRRAQPDEGIVAELQKLLDAAGHHVFRDVDIPIGQRWAEAIQQQLRECDVFIVFLSEQSVDRDMVREEVKQAYYRQKAEQGSPLILPVRLNYDGALPYDMNAWLAPIQYAFWKSPDDTPAIAKLLLNAVEAMSGAALPHAGSLATPEQRRLLLEQTEDVGRPLPKAEPAVMDKVGMKAGSPFYIEREVDQFFIDCLKLDHGVASIRAPRQMGKSSLLARTRQQLHEAGLKSVFLDLKILEHEPFADVRAAMLGLAMLIADQAELDLDPESFFTGRGFPATKLQRFLAAAFGGLPQRTVLLFDDVDALFKKPYRDGLFGGLRTIIDQKPNDPGIANIGFGFAHAQDPSSWIGDLNQSPFNVADSYTLKEFDLVRLQQLNDRHQRLLSLEQLDQLQLLLGGHPFMTRTAFYHLAPKEKKDPVPFETLVAAAPQDDGFFGDHLRGQLMRLLELKLDKAFKKILDAHKCDQVKEFEALKALGLVTGPNHKEATPRYGIYETYFKKRRLDG